MTLATAPFLRPLAAVPFIRHPLRVSRPAGSPKGLPTLVVGPRLRHS